MDFSFGQRFEADTLRSPRERIAATEPSPSDFGRSREKSTQLILPFIEEALKRQRQLGEELRFINREGFRERAKPAIYVCLRRVSHLRGRE